jgi:hypothetical protein
MIRKVLIFISLVFVAVVGYWYFAGPTASSQHSPQASAADQSVGTQQNAKPTGDTAKVAPTDGKVPKIEFPETTHDFGEVPQQTTVDYTFVVRNVGEAPLELIRAKGS